MTHISWCKPTAIKNRRRFLRATHMVAAGCRTCFDTPPVVQPRFCCHWNPPHSLNYLQYLGVRWAFFQAWGIDRQSAECFFCYHQLTIWVSKERLNYLCIFFGRLIFGPCRKKHIYTHALITIFCLLCYTATVDINCTYSVLQLLLVQVESTDSHYWSDSGRILSKCKPWYRK